MVIDPAAVKVHAKFSDLRSNHYRRDVRLPHFVTNDDDERKTPPTPVITEGQNAILKNGKVYYIAAIKQLRFHFYVLPTMYSLHQLIADAGSLAPHLYTCIENVCATVRK